MPRRRDDRPCDGDRPVREADRAGCSDRSEVTIECRRWDRGFLGSIAGRVGFTSEWHDPFISAEGLEAYGFGFFENYLANPQSKLLRLTKAV